MKFSGKPLSNSAAFSLIELLVTVAILGILSAMSLAAFNEYRNYAYATASKSDIRNMITGFHDILANREEINNGMTLFSNNGSGTVATVMMPMDPRIVRNTRISKDTVAYIALGNDLESFYISSIHCKNKDRMWYYESNANNSVGFGGELNQIADVRLPTGIYWGVIGSFLVNQCPS